MESASVYVRWLAILGATLGLAACGGGGSVAQNNPPPATYTVGGTISGLTVDGLVLANNGATVTANSGASTFSFAGALASGTAYAVTVQTTPNGLTCSVANGTGSIGTANVSNIVVTCSDKAYSLGGTISGLISSGLVLSNGTDQLSVSSGATSFTMPSQVAFSSSYDVKVATQPQGLTCSVQNGTATMGAAAVTNIAVTCTDQKFTVGGSVSGLTVSGLVLANGSDTVSVAANATAFTFPTSVDYAASYAVTVSAQPVGLMCTVSSGSGHVPAGNVTTVQVTCSNQSYSLGGTVSGLTSVGLSLTDGTDTVSVAANATGFTLPTQVAFQSHYSVTVSAQPTGETCSVSGGSGTMPASAVNSVTVTCATNSYTLGGTISGLNVTGLVLTDGTDHLAVAANASVFSMPTGVAYNSPYTVSAESEPTGLTCPITGASGTMPAAAVNSVQVTCAASMWTWLAGSSTSVNNTTVPASVGFAGVYGTQGTPAVGNLPGSRDSHMTWTDNNGRLWLFGGSALDATDVNGDLNDMWSYDPATQLWTWVSGSNLVTPTADLGNYGTQGVAAATNVPPARHGATTWIDAAGRLWMFGGANYNNVTSPVHFNDLWSFDPGTKWWTFVGGTSTQNDLGTYGTKGTAAASNAPPSRAGGTGWIDSSGTLWLFGGLYTTVTANTPPTPPTFVNNTFSDLWSFDPTTKEWTWVSGSSAMNDYAGTYGAQNVGSVNNKPPTRFGASGWIDSATGLFWLFGGGYDNAGTTSGLNDLWTYNPANKNWTWVGGSNGTDSLGTYGTQGVAAGTNQPGARGGSVAWADKEGRFWLFGGTGFDAAVSDGGTGSSGSLNDLWTFSPSSGQWTWVGGALKVNISGQYGTQGAGASGNIPGARSASSGWIDATGHLWLFGGSGLDAGGNSGDLNDLWKF